MAVMPSATAVLLHHIVMGIGNEYKFVSSG